MAVTQPTFQRVTSSEQLLIRGRCQGSFHRTACLPDLSTPSHFGLVDDLSFRCTLVLGQGCVTMFAEPLQFESSRRHYDYRKTVAPIHLESLRPGPSRTPARDLKSPRVAKQLAASRSVRGRLSKQPYGTGFDPIGTSEGRTHAGAYECGSALELRRAESSH